MCGSQCTCVLYCVYLVWLGGSTGIIAKICDPGKLCTPRHYKFGYLSNHDILMPNTHTGNTIYKTAVRQDDIHSPRSIAVVRVVSRACKTMRINHCYR
jgi:hypothetical protein